MNCVKPCLTLICIFSLLVGGCAVAQTWDEKIAAITAKPHIEDGQYLKAFTALGPEAVPALGRALLKPQRFPATYYQALANIGDKRAVAPLLEFLGSQTIVKKPNENHTVQRVIEILGRLGDSRAVDSISKVFDDLTLEWDLRLAAAGALANIADGAIQRRATKFVFARYADYKAGIIPTCSQYKGISLMDIHNALISVDSDDSLTILLDWVKVDDTTYRVNPMLKYFAGKNEPRVVEVVLNILKKPSQYELIIRLNAAETLAQLSHGLSDTQLDVIADKIIAEVKAAKYDHVIQRALALKQSMQHQ